MSEVKEEVKYFTYWEGPTIPFIELCFESMKKYCPEVVRLNPENIERYIELPGEYFKIKAINHRVDYLKAKLIYENGGYWFDADTILLKRPPDDFIAKNDYFGCPGLFGGQKGGKTLKKWYEYCDKKIKEKSEFYWHELIEPIITPLPGGQFQEIRNIDKKHIAPFFGKNFNEIFFDKINDDDLRDVKGAFAIVLYNEAFPKWFKQLSKEEIIDGNWTISEIFRLSLGSSFPAKLDVATLSNVADKINELIEYLRVKHL